MFIISQLLWFRHTLLCLFLKHRAAGRQLFCGQSCGWLHTRDQEPPFYPRPGKSSSWNFSCSHWLQNRLVPWPRSLPCCSIRMPTGCSSCCCFPEVTAALHSWELCFEVPTPVVVSFHLTTPRCWESWGNPFASVAQWKWAAVCLIEEVHEDWLYSGTGGCGDFFVYLLFIYIFIYLFIFWGGERIFPVHLSSKVQSQI